VSKATPEPAQPLGYCTISNRRDNRPQFQAGSFDDLHHWLTKHTRLIGVRRADATPEHKDGPAFILAAFKRPRVRSDGEVAYTTGLGLDVDEAHVELSQIRSLLAGYSAIVYESASSTPDARRWRVLIEYGRPFSLDEHADAFEVWSRRIPGVGSASRNPSRLWYAIQRYQDGAQRIVERWQGSPYFPEPKIAVISPREAFKRHIKPPPDLPASAGDRNSQLSKYAASVLARSAVRSESELRDALFEQNAIYDPPLPEREVAQMAKAKWKVRERFGYEQPPAEDEDSDEDESPFFLDIEAMSEAAPAGPHWIVPGWLPGRTVTLYSGDGGSGKSFVALDLAVRLALGENVFGKVCQRQRVMLVSAEDDEDILHLRVTKLCAALGRKMSELKGWLFLRDATADNNVMFADNKLTGAAWTERFDVIGENMDACGASLLILDNVSDHYDANENERAKVRQFITGLSSVLDRETAVLLLAHVDANTALNPAMSKGYSGSTAWNNSVRSRWFQYRDSETNKVMLKLMKSNYAQAGEFVEIAWNDSSKVFDVGVAERPDATLDKHAGLILRLLDEQLSAGVTVSPSHNANNNAYARLKDHPDFPKVTHKRQLFELVGALTKDGFLKVEAVPKRNGGTSQEIRLTDKGRAAMEVK
jgi:Mrp family chromosome partitioning ATPase